MYNNAYYLQAKRGGRTVIRGRSLLTSTCAYTITREGVFENNRSL